MIYIKIEELFTELKKYDKTEQTLTKEQMEKFSELLLNRIADETTKILRNVGDKNDRIKN